MCLRERTSVLPNTYIVFVGFVEIGGILHFVEIGGILHFPLFLKILDRISFLV
jgi:hypothetical protein